VVDVGDDGDVSNCAHKKVYLGESEKAY
jgi:hypothetical protein